MSKPVFAYAVLKLVDQGKLGLDVPLTKYLPRRYLEGDARLDAITARIVLSHRTGFPNWRGDGNALKILFPPGERFSYSGEGIVYLQRVVEQIAGKPLDDVMREQVFAPLGMTSSSHVWRADYDARAATGHDADGQPRPLWKPREAVAAASLNTTAKDYARFVAAILGDHPAFAWLKYDRYDSVGMQFARAIRDHGFAPAMQQYAASLKSGAVPEDTLNGVSYRLLRLKQTADAIRLFELNTTLHPQSANAYDSLAEAYMTAGRKPQAIENYQRSLALNPHNDNATHMLAKLRQAAP